MTESTKSLLQDLAFYKTGSALWCKANDEIEAGEKLRRGAKARKSESNRLYRLKHKKRKLTQL